MTRCYALGGHTRLVGRWIAAQPDAISDLVLTAPDGPEPPAELVDTVRRAGGRVHRLNGTTLERARALRSLASHVDTIVLSVHENDLVPSVALASAPARAPVIVVNHADHVFWVGASLADVLVNLRPAARELAIRRRRVPVERCVDLPLPVEKVQRRTPVGEAKRTLGIHPSQPVLLTVGWRYKFGPLGGKDLVSALEPILADSSVHLIAVGPDIQREPWAAAKDRYGDRVRPVGAQLDTRPYLEAADIFIDTFPIPSLTAALEAGMLGVPVVSLAVDHGRWPPTLQEDDPALVACVFAEEDEYVARIRHLLDHPNARLDAGRKLRARVVEWHGSESWARGLDRVQRAADESRHRQVQTRPPLDDAPGAEDLVVATYLADHEDRVVRAELHFVAQTDGSDRRAATRFNARVSRLDSLLLDSTRPGPGEYAEALSIIHSVAPWRTRLDDAGSTVSRLLRRLPTP
jgi:glycosyltransferase involved in cell wall biosynthesis